MDNSPATEVASCHTPVDTAAKMVIRLDTKLKKPAENLLTQDKESFENQSANASTKGSSNATSNPAAGIARILDDLASDETS